MRLLPFVLLYVAVASAFSPFNLAARQESVISTEVVTSTSIVISTSILTITEYATATLSTFDAVQPIASTSDVKTSDYAPTLSALPTTGTTSILPITVTPYDDTQCSIAGATIVVSTSLQSSWSACLQTNANDIAEAHSIITWSYGSKVCELIGGNGAISMTFDPRSYCAVVQYVATSSTTSTMPTTATSTATSVIPTTTSPPSPPHSIQVFCGYTFSLVGGLDGFDQMLGSTNRSFWDSCLQYGESLIGSGQGWVRWSSFNFTCEVFNAIDDDDYVININMPGFNYAGISLSDKPSSPDISCGVNVQVFCGRTFQQSVSDQMLGASTQPTWDGCLQFGKALVGAGQGRVFWTPWEYCGVVGTIAETVVDWVSIDANYAAIGFNDIPSSVTESCPLSPTDSEGPPLLCSQTGPVLKIANISSIEPWCDFQCVGTSVKPGGFGQLPYQACLQTAGALAAEQRLVTSYISWNTRTDDCDLLIDVEQAPNRPDSVRNLEYNCAIVNATLPDPLCTPTGPYTPPREGSWEIWCGEACSYIAYYPDDLMIQPNWAACVAYGSTRAPCSAVGMAVSWNRVTLKCHVFLPNPLNWTTIEDLDSNCALNIP